ncbi:hypothetical protein C1646_770410 [Rhizophagus diaphanus]|nr:hypothetical protein C1646_770410 [Rhizophagus diaphanus] [Rhizophagus sp. MUCL 43196]
MALTLSELLKNILNFLAKDNALYPTLLVSRLWSRCTGPILWGCIELIDFKRSTGFNDTTLIKISQVYPNLIHLNVSNNWGLTDYFITKIAKKCDKLQFLDIGFGRDITGKSFCEIARSCNGLKHLGINISSCSRLTDTAIHTLTDSYSNLKSLKLAHCDGISDIAIRKITQFYCLEYLNLYSMSALTADKSMRIIARSCPNIQYLNLQSCNITDGAIKEIALSCYNLKHLDLYGVQHIISDLSISKIAKICPNIYYIS